MKPIPLAERIARLPAKVLVPAYLAVHLLLDWATYIPSVSPLGITPWNPPAGLAFGFVLLKGPAYFPVLPVGTLISDVLVRGLALPLASILTEVALISFAYLAGLAYLWRARFDPALSTLRDVLRLGAVATFSAAAVGIAYVAALVVNGHLPASEFAPAAVRYWIGDTIGVVVLTPFLLLLAQRGGSFALDRAAAGHVAAILLAVLAVLGLGRGLQVELSYLLFLPVVWVAIRAGLESVSAALVLMQVAIMVALHTGRVVPEQVTEIQAMLLVLACAGLAIGVLVRERERSETSIRLQQDALARAARIGSMDRLATAIAHEINQPLTAIGNYCRTADRALGTAAPDLPLAQEAVRKAEAQVERAAAVIQRLRDLIMLGRADLRTENVERIVAESVELVRHELVAARVRMTTEVAEGTPSVQADLLQVEQMITNIVRNSIQALERHGSTNRAVAIRAAQAGPGLVAIEIADTGPGFPPGFLLLRDLPSLSSRADGLGFGLCLCKSIAEAHGGSLTVSDPGRPATVTITLKSASGDQNVRPR